MADSFHALGDLKLKLIDLGDGTFAEAVSAGSASAPSIVSQAPSTTATRTSVASSVTVVTLLAANTSRKGATIFNDSTAVLYVGLGAAASVTSYTIHMAPDNYYEVPGNYTGIITGLWLAANGNARVTELT